MFKVPRLLPAKRSRDVTAGLTRGWIRIIRRRIVLIGVLAGVALAVAVWASALAVVYSQESRDSHALARIAVSPASLEPVEAPPVEETPPPDTDITMAPPEGADNPDTEPPPELPPIAKEIAG